MNDDTLTNRHDFLLLFEVTNGNPNGDPDAGNMPRIDPNTNRGIVSDVCLKRKVRNFITEFAPARNGDSNGYGVFIQSGPALERTINRAVDAITPLEISITRCVPTRIANEADERTMGNKHIVPYALYAAKGYVSPAFAERTGFTQADLDLLFEALLQMFEHDRSAARGEMIVRGLYDFEHVGTQHENNAEQNRREARLGCAHAHKLFEGINVRLKEGVEFPESFVDYEVSCPWNDQTLPKGVRLHK